MIFNNTAMEMEKDTALNIRLVSESNQDLIIVLNSSQAMNQMFTSDFSRTNITKDGKVGVQLQVSPTFFEYSKNTRITLLTVGPNIIPGKLRASNVSLELFFPEDKKPMLRLNMGGSPISESAKSLEAVKNNKNIEVKIVLRDNLRQSTLTVD